MKRIFIFLLTFLIFLAGCNSSDSDGSNSVADVVTNLTVENYGIKFFTVGLKKITTTGQDNSNYNIVISTETRFSDGSSERVLYYNNGNIHSKYIRNSNSNKLDVSNYDYDHSVTYSYSTGNISYEDFKIYDEDNFIKQIITKNGNQSDVIENFTKTTNQENKVVLKSDFAEKREYIFDENKNLLSIKADRTIGTVYTKYNQYGKPIHVSSTYNGVNSVISYKSIANSIIGLDELGKETYKKEYIINNGRITTAYNYIKNDSNNWNLFSKEIYEY